MSFVLCWPRWLLVTLILLVGHNSGVSAQTRKNTFLLSFSETGDPVLSGTTDAVEGTKLLIMLKKPWLPDAQQRMARGLPACEGDCLPAVGPDKQPGIVTYVKDGRFSAGPFSFAGQQPKPGIYSVEIFVLPLDPTAAPLAAIEAMKEPVFVSTVQLGGASRAAKSDGRGEMHIVALEGRCDFTLPDRTHGPCQPGAIFMVLGNGRSIMLFTVDAGRKVTFAFTGGHDRQPSAENYYLGVDTLRTVFSDKQELLTEVEGECHFSLNVEGNRYYFVHCLVYNRSEGLVFKFNLNQVTRTDIKSRL